MKISMIEIQTFVFFDKLQSLIFSPLQNYYGFPCDCLACTLEREEGEEDDKERAKVLETLIWSSVTFSWLIFVCTLKVVELEDRIKDLLYDDVSSDEEDYVKDKEGNERKEDNKDMEAEDKEDKERRKHEASEEEDLKSILLAVDLSWERIGLMERRGFKVGCLNKQQKYLMLFLKQ